MNPPHFRPQQPPLQHQPCFAAAQFHQQFGHKGEYKQLTKHLCRLTGYLTSGLENHPSCPISFSDKHSLFIPLQSSRANRRFIYVASGIAETRDETIGLQTNNSSPLSCNAMHNTTRLGDPQYFPKAWCFRGQDENEGLFFR